jgi:hypothetical protein
VLPFGKRGKRLLLEEFHVELGGMVEHAEKTQLGFSVGRFPGVSIAGIDQPSINV